MSIGKYTNTTDVQKICYGFGQPFSSPTPRLGWQLLCLHRYQKTASNHSVLRAISRLQDCWPEIFAWVLALYQLGWTPKSREWLTIASTERSGISEWPYPLLPFSCVPPVISMLSTERPVHHDFYWMLALPADLQSHLQHSTERTQKECTWQSK